MFKYLYSTVSRFNNFVFQIDIETWQWFIKVRASNLPVSGPLVQEKAKEIASKHGIHDFKASSGWLTRFKGRHNISAAVLSGERASVSEVTVDQWKERLPTLISGYAKCDIFNVDETGLFYKALPERSLVLKGARHSGLKKRKDRLTVVLCVNMEGELLKPLVIGHSAKPRCFRNLTLEQLPVNWKFNKKAR
jgi:hypothetical protein